MTLQTRVAETARTLALVVLGRSLLLGAALAFGGSALLLPFVGVKTASTAGAFLGGVVASLLYRRLRGPGFTLPAVSLWIEEHVPALGYGLVTAIETGAPATLERSAGAVDWSGATRDAARKALGIPLAVTAASLALLIASIAFAPTVSRVASRIGSVARSGAGTMHVSVEVIPPAYSRRRSESLNNPSVVRALVGSGIRVAVPGSDLFEVVAGDASVPRGRP